jgi:hypothetical protein
VETIINLNNHAQDYIGIEEENEINKKSGVAGVFWSKDSNCWSVSIKRNKKTIYLGCYDDINDAILARKQGEIKYSKNNKNAILNIDNEKIQIYLQSKRRKPEVVSQKNLLSRLGEINYNNHGRKMEIVEYNKAIDILVKFDNKILTKTTYKCFKNGEVPNVEDRTVCGIGYIGIGNYVTSKDGKTTLEYKLWNAIMQRCYDRKSLNKRPTYRNCTVCEDWLNFQNFAKWFHNNYYEIAGEKMCPDKDILYKGNKLYSPNTCIFVPQYINTLFVKCDSARGIYPVGVNYRETVNNFEARCNTLDINNKPVRIHIGCYDTSTEAFNAYKTFKESYIKQVADKYKSQIPQKLYDAMYSYIVEITD